MFITDDFHTNEVCKFPCSSTTKLLLQAGADPQAVDRAKNTPLHIIVTYKKIVSDFLTLHAIIMALLETGAHIDSVNAAGQTPLSAASTGVAEIILKSQADMSLKCLAAQSIRKYNLNYIGQVSLQNLLHFLVLKNSPRVTFRNVINSFCESLAAFSQFVSRFCDKCY